MIQTIKNNFALVIAAIVLTLATLVVPVATVSAQATAPEIGKNLDCGSNIDLSGSGCNQNTSIGANQVDNTIRKIINIFSAIVGTVAVIMIIVGGFRYVTSGGSTEGVSGAKNTILYAIVGLIIVALAQIIVQFVLDKAV